MVTSEPDEMRGAAHRRPRGPAPEAAALERARSSSPRASCPATCSRRGSRCTTSCRARRAASTTPRRSRRRPDDRRRSSRALLEPLEHFEAIRRRVARLGDRLADLSYANPYEQVGTRGARGAARDARRRARAGPPVRAVRRPDAGPAGGRRRAARQPRAAVRLRGRRAHARGDVGAARRAARRGSPRRRGRDPGPVLARLPALRPRARPESRASSRWRRTASTSTPRRSPRRSGRAPARSCSASPRTRPGAATTPEALAELGDAARARPIRRRAPGDPDRRRDPPRLRRARAATRRPPIASTAR